MSLRCSFAIGSVPSARTRLILPPLSSSPACSFIVSPLSQQDNKKGFGTPSKNARSSKSSKQVSDKAADQKAVLLREGSKELRSVLKSVEKENSKKHNKGLNIDMNVAEKGKVDFVRVESWGDGVEQNMELENLKLKSFSPAFSSTNDNAPFYERLVLRLQLLESKGDISIVQAQPLPPFEQWVFGEKRYLQYLVDQHAVHDALRFAISSVQTSSIEDAGSNEENDISKEATMAVGIFNESLGLDRSEALLDDIKALSKAMAIRDDTPIELLEPTTQTMAYVKYLKQLVRIAGNGKSREQACLQLLAHVFANYVAHLTTGMRVGAKALDCIPILKESKAVSFYRAYPQHVTDPLKVLIAAVNKINHYVLLEADQEKVMEELPRAIQKTSLLLSVLAVKEPLAYEA